MKKSSSLGRGILRIAILAILGVLNIGASMLLPITIGAVAAPVAFGAGLCFLGLAAGDFALRILQPGVDTQMAAGLAVKEGNIAAGLVYIGRCILAGIVLMLLVTASRAESPPAAALALLPVLKHEQVRVWPELKSASVLGAQVEQETCRSLKSSSCWNPRAEFRTSREQGIGLGQLTRAFRPDGTTRFDSLTEIASRYPGELAGLSWENRYDSTLQIRALLLKDRQIHNMVMDSDSQGDRLAMMLAAYNGGFAGLESDRRSCAATTGCNSGKWFGHVENTSIKAKTAIPGYGKSFFAINREYVKNIMLVRRVRYFELDAA